MAGIYIHIPFCKKQCSYCDFHFSTTFESYREAMVSAICKELELRPKTQEIELVETIYLGGGTPSVLNKKELESILETVQKNYTVKANAEVTLECNPDDCSTDKLKDWKTAGINRLSIGLQSLDDKQLIWMNRAHTAKESVDAVLLAAACGFENITVDLIYGLPDLTEEYWKQTIEAIVKLPVQHISAYCLTVEDKTALATWVKSGKIKPSNNAEQSNQFTLLVETLNVHGFEQYEISNFAKNENYSRHNTAYWQNKAYLGIGPSAHGFNGMERYWNIANNQEYIRKLNANELPEEREILSPFDKFNERIMVGLRTKWGVSLKELSGYIEIRDEWKKELKQFEVKGLLTISDDRIILTEKGKLRADGIASDLFVLSR